MKVRTMDRRLLVLLVALVAIVGVVNATVYAYRWMTGTVNVAGPGYAEGAACTGFYSSTEQNIPETYLPNVGTNYNAPTYGENTITITTGDIVCTWTVDTTTYRLYESIEVTIPVTVGSWYIQDFYGFGYYRGSDKVYVYFRVEDDATDYGILTTAYLIIRRPDGTEIARLNLLTRGDQTSAIELSPGQGLRLDLYFDARGTGTVTFKVGVYVTQEPGEAPSP
jgi:hypothetical protein